MKITFFEIEDWEKEFLKKALGDHELVFVDEPLDAASADHALGSTVVSVFIHSVVDDEVLKGLPDLKLITTRSMGFDHIDVDACSEAGVSVARVPAYGDRTVAEHTFGLILALSRKIFLAYERTRRGDFDYRGLTGIDLQGKTLGIVGGGKIGMNVVQIARGFEMRVLVSDPNQDPELAATHGFTYVPFEKLLEESDVVSLHAPLLPVTKHLINERTVRKMKRGAILINTARGGLIDTKALLIGLEEKILSGVGLDVLEEEVAVKEERELVTKGFPEKSNLATIVQNHVLIAHDDAIITPHIAFNSREALERILHTTVENIVGFEDGRPVNIVNIKK